MSLTNICASFKTRVTLECLSIVISTFYLPLAHVEPSQYRVSLLWACLVGGRVRCCVVCECCLRVLFCSILIKIKVSLHISEFKSIQISTARSGDIPGGDNMYNTCALDVMFPYETWPKTGHIYSRQLPRMKWKSDHVLQYSQHKTCAQDCSILWP